MPLISEYSFLQKDAKSASKYKRFIQVLDNNTSKERHAQNIKKYFNPIGADNEKVLLNRYHLDNITRILVRFVFLELRQKDIMARMHAILLYYIHEVLGLKDDQTLRHNLELTLVCCLMVPFYYLVFKLRTFCIHIITHGHHLKHFFLKIR